MQGKAKPGYRAVSSPSADQLKQSNSEIHQFKSAAYGLKKSAPKPLFNLSNGGKLN